MGECRIKSFTATWSPWDISWRWSSSGKSTIKLPVKFRVELEPGSLQSDMIFGQLKRGRMVYGNTSPDVFTEWTNDSAIGERYWWDGTKMASSGKGKWDRSGMVATFEDAPGFYGAPGSLYMGGVLDKHGYFNFLTFVKDRASEKTIKEINWSMRIDVPDPGNGGSWWSFSDQKQ